MGVPHGQMEPALEIFVREYGRVMADKMWG